MLRVYPQENKAAPPADENKAAAAAKGKGKQAKAPTGVQDPPDEQDDTKE